MRQRCRLLGNSSYFNNKQTIGDIVATVKRVAKTKGSNENDSWYEWDIECNDKLRTFYTDKDGKNIWQQGVDVTETQVDTSSNHRSLIRIDANTNEEDIKEQVKVLANNGYFDKYF